ncbi:MAG: transketolase [Candidatus Rokuibacteriota bacterium]|nr:MAG: transketolase [Candidatus Rokubacteria bacterium]
MDSTGRIAGTDGVAALETRARAVRAATVRMAHDGKTPHVGSALSCADILVALYFHAMRIDPQAPGDQDVFVLSKGHGCMSYYATLAERGYFSPSVLATYARNGGALPEHPSPGSVPGITVATGSLGHGLPIAAGVALARGMDARPGRVYVLLSDGECNEGSVWEAAMFAAGRRLDRLVVIVDYNKLQAMGRSDEISALAPLADKWRSFGWGTREVDGHDMAALTRVLDALPLEDGRPSAIVAHTVKGKGVSFMEDDTEWHYRSPSDADLDRALEELGRPA